MLRRIYDARPRFVRRAARRLLSELPFPYRFGPAFASAYRRLMKSQWYSREQLERIQLDKLKKLIGHAYRNVPYYRRTFTKAGLEPKDIRRVEDLRMLPLLTKENVKEHFEELKAEGFERYRPVLRHTSGSTGVPLKFYRDASCDTLASAFYARHWTWMGCRFGERQAVLRGAVPDSRTFFSFRQNSLLLSSFSLGPRTVGQYAAVIEDFRPKVIRGYPSVLEFFAALLEEKGGLSIRPVGIQTSSETLFPRARRRIEEVFHSKVYDLYGNGEHVSLILECPEGGLHVNPEFGIVEFVRRNGEKASPGQTAEMVCTGLNNLCMPLIRYRIGDIAVPKEGTCGCGRAMEVVASLEGRVDDVIVTPDGRMIPPAGMTLAFEFSDSIKQCQLVQTEKNELIINIVKSAGYGEADHNFMLSQVRKRVGERMRIRPRFLDEIPKTSSGKCRFVVSHIASGESS